MKKVILMRHGDYAAEHLSSKGEQDVDAVAAHLAAENLIPDVIMHSPVTRALETALRVQEVFNRVAGCKVPLVVVSKLGETHVTSPKDLFTAETDNASTILAVTHQPNVVVLGVWFGQDEEIKPRTAEAVVFENAQAESWKGFDKPKLVKRMNPS